MRFRELKETGLNDPQDLIGADPAPKPPVAKPAPVQQPQIQKAPVQQKPVQTGQGTDDLIGDLDELGAISDNNPELDKTITAGLQALLKYTKAASAKLGVQTDAPIGESTAVYSLIDELHSQIEHLEPLGIKVAPIIATIREKIEQLKHAVKSGLEAERKAGGDDFKQNLAKLNATKEKYANEISSRLGKSDHWAKTLLSAVSHFEDQLSIDFLECCATGTGLTIKIGKTQQIAKYRLSSIVNPKIQAIFDSENKSAFKFLLNLPFTEGTGFGSGTGPAESLLGCLIPGATSASPGDLAINGETWEVKAGSYGSSPSKGSYAWLDAAKEIKPETLRAAFVEEVLKGSLKNKSRKIVTVNDQKYEVGQLVSVADFRPTGLPFLKALFELLSPEQQYSAIKVLYSLMFGTVEKKKAKLFDASIRRTVAAIMAENYKDLSELQVQLGMTEYGLGHYQSPNFIIYNSTTQDILFIQGTGVVTKATNPKYNLLATSITMGKSAKASPGVFLAGQDQDEVERLIGFQRKRPRKAKV